MKIGDYVRTKYGIAKIIKIEEDEYFFDNIVGEYSSTFEHDYIKQLFKEDLKESNIKSSPNIIGLVDVGDYVNGELVTSAEDVYTSDNIYIGKEVFVNHDELIIEEDIETIVTKEQFESMEYKKESEVN